MISLDSSRRAAWSHITVACVAAAALAACGGGSGGDADAAASPAPAYAQGAVHGVGPLQVGGTRYDESAATVHDDTGAAVDRNALALGMVVGVQASAPAAAGGAAAASAVRYRSEIEGPVSAVDAAAGTLTVLGQPVVVTASTVFDDDLRGGITRVAVGDVLEVYGFPDAEGRTVATRIEREDDGDPYKLRGTVQALDPTAHTFRIGTLTVSYAALPAAAGLLADGAAVRVELQPAPDAAGRWAAARIDAANGAPGAPAGAVQAEVEGVVTRLAGPTSFAVDGVAVDASQVARVPAGLRLGSRVEVEGTLADGVLTAREVELDDDHDADDEGLTVGGAIERVDAEGRRFVVRGIEVDYAGARFEDGTAARLAAGVRVEVRGVLSEGGSTLRAAEVDFD